MAGYTKLFSSILASTIWREDDKTRIVWITLLAMSDKRGVAEGSVPGLADFARVSVEDCEQALERLSSPDKHSRSKEHDGRRIESVDGGWRLINHGKYREKMNSDERREYLKIKQQEQRAKHKKPSTRRQHVSTNVNSGQHASTLSTHASPSPSPSPSPEAEEKTESAPLTPVGHRKHTYCGEKFCVPMFLHEEFEKQLGPGLNRFDVFSWYETLTERYRDIPVGGDVLSWIRREFKGATKALFADPQQVRTNRAVMR